MISIMVQLMPVNSCFIKVQIGLTLLMPAYPGCPGKEAVRRVSVCLFVSCLPACQISPLLMIFVLSDTDGRLSYCLVT